MIMSWFRINVIDANTGIYHPNAGLHLVKNVAGVHLRLGSIRTRIRQLSKLGSERVLSSMNEELS